MEMEEFFYDLTSFAEDDVTMEGMNLVETIKRVKPTILIGRKKNEPTIVIS